MRILEKLSLPLQILNLIVYQKGGYSVSDFAVPLEAILNIYLIYLKYDF